VYIKKRVGEGGIARYMQRRSGRGYAAFHGGANFAFTEFSEVRGFV
jgi:hypothetical protein